MHNAFITELFDWSPSRGSRVVPVNKVLARLGVRPRLVTPTTTGAMTNVAMRTNLFHLAAQVLVYGVPGDFVELGTHEGQTAVLLAKVIAGHDPRRTLHCFDAFDVPGVRQSLDDAFDCMGLQAPQVHEGLVQDTVPADLPEQIALAYLDLGDTQTTDARSSVGHCLEHVWPRVAPGGVVLLHEYCDPAVYDGINPWPGVKEAADTYFASQGTQVSVLVAGEQSQGLVRKPR